MSDSYKINSIVDILSCKLKKKSIVPNKIGIGIDYERALMILAGKSGSGLNDVVWMGDVVNSASNLCSQANKKSIKPIQVSGDIYDKLNDHNQGLFKLVNHWDDSKYHGNIVDTSMHDWYKQNCTN